MRKKLNLVAFALIFSLLLATGAGAAAYGSEWAGYTTTAVATYSDVPVNHWAYDSIQRVSAQKWFSGYPDGSFRPNGTITRGEAVKVFVTFLGLQVNPVTKTSFYDVNAATWYAPYVEAGKDLFPTRTSVQGMIPFQPDMPVSREDTIYALVNALGFGNNLAVTDESVLNMFADQSSISSNIRKHFSVALQNGLVSGYPDNTIRARDTLTRAEFATLLYRGTLVGFQDTNTAKISKVTVSPASPAELSIGGTVTFSARAVYTDGTNQPYAEMKPYDASNNGVISLSGTTVKALKEGTATIQFNDSYLRDTSIVIVVKAPTEAPVLKITDYPDTTEYGSASISGTVSDANLKTLSLTCNGKDLVVGSNGSFATDVSLDEGGNTFRFVATNQYGVKTEKNISITRKAAPLQEQPVQYEESYPEFVSQSEELVQAWGDADDYIVQFTVNYSKPLVGYGIQVCDAETNGSKYFVTYTPTDRWYDSEWAYFSIKEDCPAGFNTFGQCLGSVYQDGSCDGMPEHLPCYWMPFVEYVGDDGAIHIIFGPSRSCELRSEDSRWFSGR